MSVLTAASLVSGVMRIPQIAVFFTNKIKNHCGSAVAERPSRRFPPRL